MPHRPKKRPKLGNRPQWNTEPDYYLRERRRLSLIESIRQETGNLHELLYECPGCDQRVWEAHRGDTIFRGCHCVTLMLPPGHRLYQFDLEEWARQVKAVSAVPNSGSAASIREQIAQGRACIRTLARLDPSVHDDPFAVLKGALAGAPHSLGFICKRCQRPVRRAFLQPEITGFAFSFVVCGCTSESQLAGLDDPTLEQWTSIVTEASKLKPGVVKVRTQKMEEPPDAGGLN